MTKTLTTLPMLSYRVRRVSTPLGTHQIRPPMSVIEDQSGVGQRPRARPKGKRPRSAVTSGRKQFVSGDPNSAWARRFHDLVVGHVQDAGGRDVLSEAQFALAKRAAGLECELEQMEGRISQGEQVDLDR
jgi:hypothetical protein